MVPCLLRSIPGEGTPYARLLAANGEILFIGAGLEANTAFHTLEAEAEVPYLMNDEPDAFTIIARDRTSVLKHCYRHRDGIPRQFGALDGVLAEAGVLRNGRLGNARFLLLSGAKLRNFLLPILKEDPGFLLAQTQPFTDPGEGLG